VWLRYVNSVATVWLSGSYEVYSIPTTDVGKGMVYSALSPDA
jgi:hypothetical protein